MALSTKLPAGSLRHRIQIVAPNGVQDDFGGTNPSSGFSPVATCWANIQTASGRDAQAVSSFVSTVSHMIVVRYRRNATTQAALYAAGMQVFFGARRFLIQAVLDPDERTKMLYLVCLEINGGQQQGATSTGLR